MTNLLSVDKSSTLETSRSESEPEAAQTDPFVVTVETALVSSDDKLAGIEKSVNEDTADATQADVLATTEKSVLFGDLDASNEVAPEVIVGPKVLATAAPSESPPKPVEITNDSKLIPVLGVEVEKISVKKLEPIVVNSAKVKKTISDDEEPSKAVVEMQASPKPEPNLRPEEVVFPTLGTEADIAVPEISAKLEVTSTLAPIETATRGSSRIKINAINNSWIQIRDDNLNTMLVTRLLAAGDSYAVPDQPGLVLLTGNAGALEIVVDGTIVPSIGGPGVVRRGVVLDVTRLKAGAAVSN
jgi:cytoskeleton protein RodZ